MNIDSIQNGIVIDHIQAGKAMQLYHMLGLEQMECPVAIIKNATSRKMGKKDIIKIDGDIELNLDVLGYVSPSSTVNIIKNGSRVEKRHIDLPLKLTNILKCKNPRCITTTEQEIRHVFLLTDTGEREYRCLYCDVKASE